MPMKNMFMLLTLLMTAIASTADARIHEAWHYDRLSKEAELIVIAIPIENKKTSKTSKLPNISPEIIAKSQMTTFIVLGTLKGTLNEKTFILHHYYIDPPQFFVNGPMLVNFEINKNKNLAYILFLKNESGNTYVTMSSQTDPADSIQRVGTSEYSDEYIEYLLKDDPYKEYYLKAK